MIEKNPKYEYKIPEWGTGDFSESDLKPEDIKKLVLLFIPKEHTQETISVLRYGLLGVGKHIAPELKILLTKWCDEQAGKDWEENT